MQLQSLPKVIHQIVSNPSRLRMSYFNSDNDKDFANGMKGSFEQQDDKKMESATPNKRYVRV